MLEKATLSYRFGEYEVESCKRLLLRDGQRVALTPKAFDVLLALVERHGETVTKDELMRTVWADTLVEEISLTRNVSVLRKILGDKPDQHDYIVTVPGTGYRFVAPVDRVESRAGEKQHAAIRLAPARKAGPWMAIPALAAVVFSVWYYRPTGAPPAWRSVPLTTLPGMERNPALSPAGDRVAFTWNGEKQDNFDVYIKSTGSGTPLRLTTNPAEDASPAWSPDGRTIAFVRLLGADRQELLLIPALGGPEHKLAEIRSDFRLPSLAWSPDGRWLAVSHNEREDTIEALFLVSAVSGEKRRLTEPPRGYDGDYMPAFSPDGRAVAFARLSGWSASDVYLLPLSENLAVAGPLRRIGAAGRWAISPAWSPDGRHILYLFGDPFGQAELRRSSVSVPAASEPVTSLEGDAFQLSLGRHLVYSQETGDTNIWRAEIPLPGGPPAVPGLLIASTRHDWQPRYSPDGKKIAFGSTRSGAREIWIADADGSNCTQLTSFGGPTVGFMNWSPDGRWLVFHARPQGQADLYTIAASGGGPKRLTTDPSDDVTPSFSHDGRWIYFASLRSGQWETWRMPAVGGDATRITHAGGVEMPLEAPGGKAVYYCLPGNGIWRAAAEGGEVVQVAGPVSRMCAFAVASRGIYYTAPPDARSGHSTIQFLDFAGASRPVVVSDRPFGMGLTVSPDQSVVLFTRLDQANSDLMWIEDFSAR